MRTFSETFEIEFDETCRFFMCLSEGALMEKVAHDQENLANFVKQMATGLLPNISLSPAALGIPIPLSINLNTGLAVAAVIDFYLYAKRTNKTIQANRLAAFFSAQTPLQRAMMKEYGDVVIFLLTKKHHHKDLN